MVDQDTFTKVYIRTMHAFRDLSKTGLRFLLYVFHKMPQDRDYILFDMKEAKEITGYKSEKSIFTGLGELIECEFLARSNKPYLYYINPTIAFNGSRLTLIDHYEIEVDKGDPKISISRNARKLIESNFEI